MRYLAVVVVAACGVPGPDVTVTTQLEVTRMNGTGPSVLDALVGQSIDVEIVLDAVRRGSQLDRGTCKSLTFAMSDPERTARGPTAELVQREILDRLILWQVRLELCENPALSTVVLGSVIDELNLSIGCVGVPGPAHVYTNHYPALTSFTATSCSATVLDVVANRELGGDGFAMTIETGPDRIP